MDFGNRSPLMGKTYHAPGKASQAPAGQAPGKPSTPSGRAPGKNVPRAFGPRTGETLTTHLRSTHWGGIMARAFGPSTLDNLPHASATHPGRTTRWGKNMPRAFGPRAGGKTCHTPTGHVPGKACHTPSVTQKENMPHAFGSRAKGNMPHAFRSRAGKYMPLAFGPRAGESIPHAFGQCALGNLPTPPGHSSGAKHGTRIQAKRPGNPMTHFGTTR